MSLRICDASSVLSLPRARWLQRYRAGLVVLSIGAANLPAADQAPPPPTPPPQKSSAVDFARDIAPVIKKYCYECHTGDEPEGEFSLHFTKEQDFLDRVTSEREFFEKMAENLRDRKMPPEDAPQPEEAARNRLVEWVERKLLAPAPKKAQSDFPTRKVPIEIPRPALALATLDAVPKSAVKK